MVAPKQIKKDWDLLETYWLISGVGRALDDLQERRKKAITIRDAEEDEFTRFDQSRQIKEADLAISKCQACLLILNLEY